MILLETHARHLALAGFTIFCKAISGGLIGVLVVWAMILIAFNWRLATTGEGESLGAVAGGWDYLLQLPIVVIALSSSFGIGFYSVVRWIVHP